MSDRESNVEQPSEQQDPDSHQFAPGQGYLLAAAVSLAVALVLVLVGQSEAVKIPTGTYAILATLTAGGFAGWLVRSEGSSVKRDGDARQFRLGFNAGHKVGYDEGRADGFVEGAAGTSPPRRVQHINPRRPPS